MKLKTTWMAFWLLSAVTVAVIGFSLYARTMAGVLIYDHNFEIVSEVAGRLSQAEVDHVIRTARAAVTMASWPLFPVLVAWIAAALVHLLRLKRFDA